jgi:hypothetical protein
MKIGGKVYERNKQREETRNKVRQDDDRKTKRK